MISGKQIEKYSIRQEHLSLSTPGEYDIYSATTVEYVNNMDVIDSYIDGGVIYSFTGDTRYDDIKKYSDTTFPPISMPNCWSSPSDFVFIHTPFAGCTEYWPFILDHCISGQLARFVIDNNGNNDHVKFVAFDGNGQPVDITGSKFYITFDTDQDITTDPVLEIIVDPPTNNISSISVAFKFAPFKAVLVATRVSSM